MRSNGEMTVFYGGPFSNWFPCVFTDGQMHYNCSEQFFMARKAKFFDDYDMYANIMLTDSPMEQKEFGKRVANYDDAKWSAQRYDEMFYANYLKFSQNPDLKEFLLQTGNQIIVEASPYDTIWGIGLDVHDDNVFDKTKWRGQNLLGKVLMDLRDWFNMNESIHTN